jgi:hypothetical protein
MCTHITIRALPIFGFRSGPLVKIEIHLVRTYMELEEMSLLFFEYFGLLWVVSPVCE